jgi:hypothetical protein
MAHDPRGVSDPARYWEVRRIWYNVLLTAQVALFVIRTWPHFKPAMTISSLGKMLVLALLANVCYSAAYLGEIADSDSAVGRGWRRRRGVVFVVGTLVALLLAQYWIGDEIYPDVGR